VGAQGSEQTNLLVERTADHPHPCSRREPARLRQLDQTVAFAGI
jgi:hypothetical protein